MSIRSDITAEHEWFCGEDKLIDFTVRSNRLIQDITGYSIEFRMSVSEENTTSVLTLDAALSDPENGLCRVTVADTDTDDIDPDTYYYQLWRVDDDAEAVLAHGDAVLLPAVV